MGTRDSDRKWRFYLLESLKFLFTSGEGFYYFKFFLARSGKDFDFRATPSASLTIFTDRGMEIFKSNMGSPCAGNECLGLTSKEVFGNINSIQSIKCSPYCRHSLRGSDQCTCMPMVARRSGLHSESLQPTHPPSPSLPHFLSRISLTSCLSSPFRSLHSYPIISFTPNPLLIAYFSCDVPAFALWLRLNLQARSTERNCRYFNYWPAGRAASDRHEAHFGPKISRCCFQPAFWVEKNQHIYYWLDDPEISARLGTT